MAIESVVPARRPRIGIRIPACDRIDRVAQAVALAERLGFDSAWLPDSQLIWRDTWMALSLAATRTTHITLGTAVTNVVTRHPSVIASATRTLQELAPNRFVLGLGVGWSSAGMVGLPAAGHRDFAQAVRALRALLGGDVARFGTIESRLSAPAGPCPIYLGAQGPLNLRLAGEAADGIVLSATLAQAALEEKFTHVRNGTAAAGRRFEDIDVVVWAPTLVTDDLTRALKRIKPTVAIALRNQPADELAAAGLEATPEAPLPAGFEPDGTHVADWDTAVQACDRLISDDIAHRWATAFALVGSPASLAARLGELSGYGVSTLVLTPLGADSNQTLPTALIEDVSAAFGLS